MAYLVRSSETLIDLYGDARLGASGWPSRQGPEIEA